MGKKVFEPSTLLNPLPVVMVSCGDVDKSGIITVAWAGTICSEPPMVSVSVRKSRYSHELIKSTGEFVINLVTEDLVKACDWCGVKSGRDFDKFLEMGLTKLESETVSAPGILESPIRLECKVKNVLELGSHDMFVSEVTTVTAEDIVVDENGKLDLLKAGLVCYSHGKYFPLGAALGSFGYSIK